MIEGACGMMQLGIVAQLMTAEPNFNDGPPWHGKAIANLLLSWFDADSQAATPLKLQKVIYFCHLEFMKQAGLPLVKQEFEAWKYGPVLPAVYEQFKHFSKRPITGRAVQFDPLTATESTPTAELNVAHHNIVHEAYRIYAQIDEWTLSDISHHPAGPWAEALQEFENGSNINRRISNRLITRWLACGKLKKSLD